MMAIKLLGVVLAHPKLRPARLKNFLEVQVIHIMGSQYIGEYCCWDQLLQLWKYLSPVL